MPDRSIELVLAEHTEALMALPGVVGTGQGIQDAEPCIRVYVSGSSPELLSRIPPSLEGYAVDVVETGEFRARGVGGTGEGP